MSILLQRLSFEILGSFIELNVYMKEHAREEVTVEGLKDMLTENIRLIRAMHDPRALSLADSLEKAVKYT